MYSRILRRAVLPCALAAAAVPAAAAATLASEAAGCSGILSSATAQEQFRDDVSYFVKLGADWGLRRNSGEFFSFYAQQHAGSIEACEAIPEP